jgi:ribosome maturation factor RimP
VIDKTNIEKLVSDYISGTAIFKVKVTVSTGNKIKVLVNKKDGISIDECVSLSKHIEANLDRELEDFDLQVSSPGLGEALLVPEQYEMVIGRTIEVLDDKGQKHRGILKEFSGPGFIMETTVRHKGKKKETADISFNINEVISVKEKISFK